MTKKSKKISAGNADPGDTFFDRLGAACAGWFYMSETDAALEPFLAERAGAVTKETVLKATGNPENASLEQGDLDVFFSHLWLAGDAEPKRSPAVPIKKLRQMLEDNLTDLNVYRIGRIRIDIYVVGLDDHGNLVGIKTRAVET
jgi:hypothetical protein